MAVETLAPEPAWAWRSGLEAFQVACTKAGVAAVTADECRAARALAAKLMEDPSLDVPFATMTREQFDRLVKCFSPAEGTGPKGPELPIGDDAPLPEPPPDPEEQHDAARTSPVDHILPAPPALHKEVRVHCTRKESMDYNTYECSVGITVENATEADVEAAIEYCRSMAYREVAKAKKGAV